MSKGWKIGSIAAALLIGSATVAMALPAKDFQGRPGFQKGKAFGAFVWHDAKGHHVRFTTMGKLHVFKGKVCAPGGIASWTPVRTDYGDAVRKGPKGHCIFFHFKTKGGLDGFTFRAPKGKVITYAIKKGKGHHMLNKNIHIGRNGVHPANNPFVLNRKWK